MKRPLIIFAAVIAAAVLLVLGYFGGRRQATTAPMTAHPSAPVSAAARKVLY